jgi:alpha-1,2-mannosyltransferase
MRRIVYPTLPVVAALALWLVPACVLSLMVASRPERRTVTPLYHGAAAHWCARQDLYSGPSGMNYLPHFAILFAPFHAMPAPWGDVLWRWCAVALIASGLGRIIRAQFGEQAGWWFLWATVLTLPLSLGALRNGQANAHLAGLMLHAVASLPHRQWWRAAAIMALAVAVKPLGIVLWLLASALYAPLRFRAALALVALAAFPLLLADSAYVMSSYSKAWTNLRECTAVTEHRFADLNGILRTLGTELRAPASSVVRLLAGGVTLALCWLASRRLQGAVQAMCLHSLAASYLMLGNPMTESNSYVILAPSLAFWSMFWLQQAKTASFGAVLAAVTTSLSVLPTLLRPWCGNYLALFLAPTMTLLFVALLLFWLRSCRHLRGPCSSVCEYRSCSATAGQAAICD